MTDVLQRPVLEQVAALRPDVGDPAPPTTVCTGLAALAAVAAAIHLVMVPSHWTASSAEGIGFLAAGGIQLVMAGALLARPSRRVLAAAAAVSALFVGAWAVSRTAGLPYGSHPGHAEDASFVDLTAVAVELLLLAWCGLLLIRGPGRAGRGLAPLVAALVAVMVGTAAIASPGARDHATHGHGDATGATTAAATDGAGSAPGHDHEGGEPPPAAAVDDRGLAALSNGHHHAIGPEQPLDRATRAELAGQIRITQEVAATYPTVADAVAAGYRRTGPYFPGIGAHFIRTGGPELNPDGVMSEEDLRSPLAIIYEGTDPDARVAGFMYYSMSADEPAGFAGPNDVWHYHTNICLRPSADGLDAPFGADHEVPAGVCEQAGGRLIQQTQWMVHVWSVPGWESQQGLFGEVNPALACPDGSYHQRPIEEWIDHPLNACADVA